MCLNQVSKNDNLSVLFYWRKKSEKKDVEIEVLEARMS